MDDTKFVGDTTSSRNKNESQLTMVQEQNGDHVMLKNKEELTSQGHGDGEKIGCDKSDIDPPEIEIDIDENWLDGFISNVLQKATHDLEYPRYDIDSPEHETDIDENRMDDFIRGGLKTSQSVEKLSGDKPDKDSSEIETDIDENRLDDHIKETLRRVSHDVEKDSNDKATKSADAPYNPVINKLENWGETVTKIITPTGIIHKQSKLPKENVDGEKLRCDKLDIGPSTMDTEIDVSDGMIEIQIKDTLDLIIEAEVENLGTTTRRQPVVLNREYPTYTPKHHVTIGTLAKIITRLGLKKNPRYQIEKIDISWPLPGSLVIRGPDGQLEDGLIGMYIGDLLNYIVTSEKRVANVTGRSIPTMPFSASATIGLPNGDKAVTKETKSEGDISARDTLPSTSKKSRKFLSRLFGDCRRSKKSLRNNTDHDLSSVA